MLWLNKFPCLKCIGSKKCVGYPDGVPGIDVPPSVNAKNVLAGFEKIVAANGKVTFKRRPGSPSELELTNFVLDDRY